MATVQQQTTPAKNGTATKEKAPPAKTEAIDLSIDPATLKLDTRNEDGMSLLSYYGSLDDALESLETLEEKRAAVNREIAKRLHANGIPKIRVLNGKNVALDSKDGEVFRVRGVNGSSPPVYQIYPETPRKVRDKPAVNMGDI